MHMEDDQQALSLSWVFGASTDIKHCVLNLSDGSSDRVCYITAHTGVIYDKRQRKQIFLQGHTYPIACLAATDDRSTLITADMGPESLLVVWNSRTGLPLRTVQRPHPHGVLAMDTSPDGQWLATVSNTDAANGEQEVSLWSLNGVISGSSMTPLVTSAVPSGDPQASIRFNMNNPQELITNGRRRVYFWSWSPGVARFKYYSPPLRSKDFKQPVGDFVMSVFVPGTTQALTGTSDGDLVVWDEQGMTAQMGTSAADRRATKLMRVHNAPITLLITVGDYLVTGGEDGYVRFFDPLLRIVAWFEDLGAGPITGVAFSSVLPELAALSGEATEVLNRFLVPDFVVATREGRLLSVRSQSFEEFDVSKRTGTPVIDTLLTDIVALAAHPTRAEIAVLGKSGVIQRWDSIAHLVLGRRKFDKPPLSGSCMAYSRDGAWAAVGFEAGHLYIVSGDDLQDLHTVRSTTGNLTHVATSSTGTHIAAADSHNQLLLYAHMPHKHTMRWEYVGRIKAHHAPVVAVQFGESPSGKTRLFSAGSDGRVVEYDLAASSAAAGVRVSGHFDFPPGVLPTALSFAPPLQYFSAFSAETQLLVCDDAYKLRVYTADEHKLAATFLGPTFAGPLRALLTCKSTSSDSVFLAYHAGERVVGLIAWPLDGDPAQTMGLIAHPGPVRAIAVSYDGRKLFTAGADGTLACWDVSTPSLEACVSASLAQGAGRWARVIADDELLTDLKDYFVLAQLKAQGEDSLEPRAVTGKVPLELLPDLMRAVGFYPSQADIANLMHHVEWMAASRDVEPMSHVDLTDFLALYVNHRPLVNVSQEDVVAAFRDLGAKGETCKMPREVLVAALQQLGEAMSKEELDYCVSALTGAAAAERAMPNIVSAAHFGGEVLGFEIPDASPAAPAAH